MRDPFPYPHQMPVAGLRYGDHIVLDSAFTNQDAGNIVYVTMEAPIFHVHKATWAPALKAYSTYEHATTYSLRLAVEMFSKIVAEKG